MVVHERDNAVIHDLIEVAGLMHQATGDLHYVLEQTAEPDYDTEEMARAVRRIAVAARRAGALADSAYRSRPSVKSPAAAAAAEAVLRAGEALSETFEQAQRLLLAGEARKLNLWSVE